jgi:competence protein ComEC
VLSILLFYKPIYHWLYFPNKIVDAIWKLVAVSIAAQILTLPISVYYFHQFPIIFLISNIVAVPLSSLILIGEILLCCLAWFPVVATVIGQLLFYLLQGMNTFVERLDALPFAVWQNLSLSPIQTFLLYLFIAAIAVWLLEEKRKAVWIGLGSLLLFSCLRTSSFLKAGQQQELIVYNIPKHSAIDIIQGRDLTFIGDAAFVEDDFLRNFHLQPSRVQHRIKNIAVNDSTKLFSLNGKRIVLLDTAVQFNAINKPQIDVLILSRNPKLYLKALAATCNIKQLVLDGSVPRWKASLWKKDAAELHIPCYDVSEKGAFVMNF